MARATSATHRTYSIEELVQLEEFANLKHEFLAGQAYLDPRAPQA